MNVELSGRHLDLTAAIRQQVDERAGKLAEKCSDAQHVEVVLEVQKLTHTAELVLKTRSHRFVTKHNSEDMYNSINSAFDHIEAQVRKWRGKRTDSKRQPPPDMSASS